MCSKMSELVERLRIACVDLREMVATGKERVVNYCEFLRQDIEITAESKIEELHKEQDQTSTQSKIEKIKTDFRKYTDELITYEKQRLSDLKDKGLPSLLMASLETTIRNASEFSVSVASLDEANELINRIRDCMAKVRHTQFNWIVPKFIPAVEHFSLGTLYFENTEILTLDKMRGVQLDLEYEFRASMDQRFIERLVSGYYFVIEYFNQEQCNIYRLFDTSGKLLYKMVQNNDLTVTVKAICHVNNYVVVSRRSDITVFDCSDGTIKEVVDKETAHLSAADYVLANSEFIYREEEGDISVYNWSLICLQRIDLQCIDPAAPFQRKINRRRMRIIFVSLENVIFYERPRPYLWIVDRMSGAHVNIETGHFRQVAQNSTGHTGHIVLLTFKCTLSVYDRQGRHLSENALHHDGQINQDNQYLRCHVCPHLRLMICEDDTMLLVDASSDNIAMTVYFTNLRKHVCQ